MVHKSLMLTSKDKIGDDETRDKLLLSIDEKLGNIENIIKEKGGDVNGS